MSVDDIKLVDPHTLNRSALFQSATALGDAETFAGVLDDLVLSQKRAAEWLGVSEGTLSRWISEDRVPTAVTELVIAVYALDNLKKEVHDLRRQAIGAKIVKTETGYLVCKFSVDEDGVEIGHVLATAPDMDKARKAVASVQAFASIPEVRELIGEMLERTENSEYIEQLEEFDRRLVDMALFATDFEAWKDRKKPLSLDDLFPPDEDSKAAEKKGGGNDC